MSEEGVLDLYSSSNTCSLKTVIILANCYVWSRCHSSVVCFTTVKWQCVDDKACYCKSLVQWMLTQVVLWMMQALSKGLLRCTLTPQLHLSFWNIALSMKMELTFSPPTPFLALPGEPPVLWPQWHKSFENYITVLGLTWVILERQPLWYTALTLRDRGFWTPLGLGQSTQTALHCWLDILLPHRMLSFDGFCFASNGSRQVSQFINM